MESTVLQQRVSRAQGCLLGQLAGDALGSLVEFQGPEEIVRRYPQGVRELASGGTWNTLAGQPTDDSEMALLLARMLVRDKRYQAASAMREYVYWLDSAPFDCGLTIASGLRGKPNVESQANGALMRISPLGIFGAGASLESVAAWAGEDAELTHPHAICHQANTLYAMAITRAVRQPVEPADLYRFIAGQARQLEAASSLLEVIETAAVGPPEDYVKHQGWVLIAFHNALYQLLHAVDLEEGVVATVMGGGDTDTNAAICGALLGAVHGREAVPRQWVDSLLVCRPQAEEPGVNRPRPRCFWPVDVLELAEQLLHAGGALKK